LNVLLICSTSLAILSDVKSTGGFAGLVMITYNVLIKNKIYY